MTPARISTDFSARRKRFSVAGILILSAGVFAAYWTVNDYRKTSVASELFNINLARYDTRVDTAEGRISEDNLSEITAITEQLNTPWSSLLDDLEQATGDNSKDVALLEVAPDRDKQTVRISGEARSLNAVLDYVTRLQTAQSVVYPLLESHEIQTADSERPVHFEVSADWRLSQ